jgi:uncharacterized protein YndB with AHSA1/START domain
MATRSQWHEVDLPAKPEAVFNLLLSPKAIRGRWDSVGAVITEVEGQWVLAWGERESNPDYVLGGKIKSFSAPSRVLLALDYCRARNGFLPYASAMTVEFTIQKIPAGALLRVTHTGFPAESAADAHYDSCGKGWRAALQGIATLLAPPPKK